jgi:hypothetical protein
VGQAKRAGGQNHTACRLNLTVKKMKLVLFSLIVSSLQCGVVGLSLVRGAIFLSRLSLEGTVFRFWTVPNNPWYRVYPTRFQTEFNEMRKHLNSFVTMNSDLNWSPIQINHD